MKKAFLKKIPSLTKKDQTPKIGFWLSIAILAIVILGMIAVFGNTHRAEIFLDLRARLLSYYHFFINIVAGIIATINIVEFALIKKDKIKKLNNWLHICNLSVASCLILNFFFTLLYLVPLSTHISYDAEYLYAGSNMLFNIFVPALYAILYIFCFKGYSLKNKWSSLIAIVPAFLYFTLYMILSLTHLKDGVSVSEWEMYLFGSKQWYLIIIAYLIIMLFACAISIGTWKLNKIAKLNRWMFIFVANMIIAILIIPFTAWMFDVNINIESYKEGLTKLQSGFMRFLYFTHLSSWLLGATSIIYCVYSFKIYQGQIKQVPIWAQVMRLAAVVSVSVTLFMQAIVAASYMLNYSKFEGGWEGMLTETYIKCFQKYLMFEHFIIPVIAIVSFIFFEHSQLKWKHLLWSATPLAIYVLVYTIVVYAHIGQPLRKDIPGQEGYVTPWDIYDVTSISPNAGKYFYWVVPFVTYGLMLVFNWIFWMLNRKIHFDLPKKGPVWAELKSDWAKWKAK